MRELKQLLIDAEGKEEIEVTIEEYTSLLKEANYISEMPPTPPIKARQEFSGFFSWGYGVEYDHHAPAYLRELQDYKARVQSKARTAQVLSLYTTTGPCKLRIKK